ncbi:GNAT family N-acetyltransferase [Mycolicibacillus koreensis]|nr:GNAT family N-acetyltransferase [Mycolicibacillus koreensis]
MTEPTITHVDQHHRYEIAVDGTRAGLSAYVDNDTQRIFYHTEVGEDFAGQGLASKLTGAALADTQAAGKRIVAICSLVAGYVDKHHEFDDIVDPVTPEAQRLVRRQSAADG